MQCRLPKALLDFNGLEERAVSKESDQQLLLFNMCFVSPSSKLISERISCPGFKSTEKHLETLELTQKNRSSYEVV